MPKKHSPSSPAAPATTLTKIPAGESSPHKRLAELESLYRTASVGIGLLDSDLRYVHVNEALAAVNGVPVDDHVGKTVRDIIPEIADKVLPILQGVLQTGEPVLNTRIKGTTFAEPGIERHWIVNYAPVMVDGGRIVGVSKVIMEVTALENANEELRLYKRIVSAAPDHMSFVDTKFYYRAVSDAYLHALGRERPEIVGRPVAELLGQETFERIVRPRLEKCLAGEEVHYQEWFSFPTTGNRFMDCRYSRFVTSDGTPGGVIVTARDFTERKTSEEHQRELESKLREAKALEAVGRLAAGVSHDVNSLLMIILGNSQLIRKHLSSDGTPLAQPVAEALERIDEAVDRGKTMVQSLLAFSRAGASKPVMNDLNRNVTETINLVRDLLGPTTEVRSKMAPDLNACIADPGQMEQVILNLLLNARDAMEGGGQITIETANVDLSNDYARAHSGVQPGPHVMLSVGDTGSGMDDHTKAHLFEPFFTTKKVGAGSGLGLSIVYGIVTQSKGHIAVKSTPGVGTTFRLYFPVADQAGA